MLGSFNGRTRVCGTLNDGSIPSSSSKEMNIHIIGGRFAEKQIISIYATNNITKIINFDKILKTFSKEKDGIFFIPLTNHFKNEEKFVLIEIRSIN